MPAQMLVIFKTPADKEAFDKHYMEIHAPLAKKLPGLRKYEVNDNKILSVAAQIDTYFIVNLYFDSMDAMRSAFASPEGKACAADRKKLVPNDADVQIYLFETKEI